MSRRAEASSEIVYQGLGPISIGSGTLWYARRLRCASRTGEREGNRVGARLRYQYFRLSCRARPRADDAAGAGPAGTERNGHGNGAGGGVQVFWRRLAKIKHSILKSRVAARSRILLKARDGRVNSRCQGNGRRPTPWIDRAGRSSSRSVYNG